MRIDILKIIGFDERIPNNSIRFIRWNPFQSKNDYNGNV
jgi:hypothetical protein